jgi:hypothetical protein
LICRGCDSIHQVYKQLVDCFFRRAYRLTYATFEVLESLLRRLILKLSRKFVSSSSNRSRTQNGPNGIISPSVRLACAIRYFAGGSPYNLITKFGIGYSDFFRNVWIVVEAINLSNHFDIVFPADHDTQRLMVA